MLPPVNLAPWELPPDCEAPLTAPADFVFHSLWQSGLVDNPRETEIHLRVVPYKDAFLHYFCDSERPHTSNWVLGTVTHFPYRESALDFDNLSQFFREYDDLWYEYMSRLIYIEGAPLGSPGTYCITVRPSGADCFIQYGTQTTDDKNNWRCVKFPSPFKTARAPLRGTTTKKQLLDAFQDPNSIAHYAFSDVHVEPRKRQKQAKEFERTNLAPMKRLLTAVLQSQSDLWQTGQPIIWQTYRWSPKDQMRQRKSHWDGNYLYFGTNRIPNLDIPSRLRAWKTVLWNTHIATPREEWLFYSGLPHPPDDGVSVKVAPPTGHESMEALLLLRDWWHDKFPALPFDNRLAP